MDQVAEKTKAKGCSAASGGVHKMLSIMIGRESRSILRELVLGLLISIPAGPARCLRIIPYTLQLEPSTPTGKLANENSRGVYEPDPHSLPNCEENNRDLC